MPTYAGDINGGRHGHDSFGDGGENRDLVDAIKDLVHMLVDHARLGLNSASMAPVPAQQPLLLPMAPMPPPMPGSAAAMQQSGANQYGAPIGPSQAGMMRPYRSHDLSESPEGFFGSIGHGVLGAIPGMVAGAADYAGANTPYGTTGTTDMLGRGLQMGMLKQLSDVGGKVPGLGGYLQGQFKGLETAVFGPERQAASKLGSVYGKMARAGINVTDQEMEEAFKFAIPFERREIFMKQRVDRMAAATGSAMNSVGVALNQLGW